MFEDKFVINNGVLCRRLLYGAKPLKEDTRVKWGDNYKKVEELYWEVHTGELLPPGWTVKRIKGRYSELRMENLVKVMHFPGTYTLEYVRSHFDYDFETGKVTRKYVSKLAEKKTEESSLCINGERFETHRFIWLWMTGQNLLNGDKVIFKNGDRTNFKWENLALDRRKKPRSSEQERGEPIVYRGAGAGADVVNLTLK